MVDINIGNFATVTLITLVSYAGTKFLLNKFAPGFLPAWF
jgi:hypothetical protein